MYRNVGIIRNVVKAMRPFKRDAVLLIVSNPVDLATQVAQQLSGLPDAQVIGSGTLLDSVRLSQLLADKAGVCFSRCFLALWPAHATFRYLRSQPRS
jgi:L-lactate dehydrogenase